MFVLPLGVFILLGAWFYQNSKKDAQPVPTNTETTETAPKNMVQHGVDFSDQKAVEVIDYDGDYILVSALRIGEPHPKHADGPGCPEKHWHADAPVTAVNNGKILEDPAAGGCGFGTLAERPIANYFPHDLLAE